MRPEKMHETVGRTVYTARTLVDLMRRICFSGLQLEVTKRIGTAARRKVK